MRSPGDDSDEDGDTRSVLYDVLVYNEWRVGGQDEEARQQDQQQDQDSADSKSRWGTLAGYLAPRLPWRIRSQSSPVQRFLDMQDMRITWRFAVSPDASLVAVAQDDVLEILSRCGPSPGQKGSGPNYVAVSRAELPPDPAPRLRCLSWSGDGLFLAVTASNGRVFVYDATGDLVFAVVSNNLPPWNAPSSIGSSYCKVEFVETRDVSTDGDWHSELFVMDFTGNFNTFLCSRTGYQELASSSSVARAYTAGISDAVVLPELSLLYVCGQSKLGVGSSGITCWRMTEEEPFLQQVEIADRHSESSGLWRRITGPGVPDDFAYLLAVSEDGRSLAAAHVSSGDISVWSLPSLVRRRVIPLEEQGCHDDVNPHCLRKGGGSGRSKAGGKSVFLKHPLRFHPTSLRWWDGASLVVGRLSGGLTILPVREPGENLLGESAEFFAPSPSLSQCFEFGFFGLEVDGEKRFLETDANAEEAGVGWREYLSDIADSVFRGRSEEDEEEKKGQKGSEEEGATYRLLYFQSTSPEELFQKKIEEEEYGEAVVLARHFGLNCDRVYVEQWRASNHSAVAAQDYLSKVEAPLAALRECACAVPATAEACRSLLSFGLARAEMELVSENGEGVEEEEEREKIAAVRDSLRNFVFMLDLYLATCGGDEEEYSAKEFAAFRSRGIKETAVKLALGGDSRRLKNLFEACSVEGELGSNLTSVLSSLPEPFDPMPEIADLTVSLKTAASKVRPPATVDLPDQGWFKYRADEMVRSSGQSDYALSMLHLAANLGESSVDPFFYHHLATYDALVFEKKDLGVGFDKLCQMDDLQLLKVLLYRPRPNAAKVFKTLGLPFLDRVEQCRSGGAVDLFRRFVVDLAPGDFITASDLVRVVADNLEETWFSASDLRSFGADVVWGSGSSADIQGLASFLAYLKQFCVGGGSEAEDEREFSSLLEAVKTLGIVNKYDNSATIAAVKEAQGAGAKDKAASMITSVVNSAKDLLRSKPALRNEVLHDVLTITASCQDLDLRTAFQIFCRTILELGDFSAIELAKDIMSSGTKQRRDSLGSLGVSKTPGAELKKTMSHFGLGPPSTAEMCKLVAAAAATYLGQARCCTDDKVKLAEACVGAAPAGEEAGAAAGLREARDFVGAVLVLSKFGFVSPLRPSVLRRCGTPDEVGKLLHSHIVLERGGAADVISSLGDFAVLLSRSLGLDGKETRAWTLAAAARVALEAGDRAASLEYCLVLAEERLGAAGWKVCHDLVEDAEFVEASALRALRTFSSAYCDRGPSLEDVCQKLAAKDGGDPSLFAARDVVPGFTFAENSLESWDSTSQARRLADIFGEPDAYKKGSVFHQLGDQHVFEQDMALALAATDEEEIGKDQLGEEEEEDSIVLLKHSLVAGSHAAFSKLGNETALSLSLLHLCNVCLMVGKEKHLNMLVGKHKDPADAKTDVKAKSPASNKEDEMDSKDDYSPSIENTDSEEKDASSEPPVQEKEASPEPELELPPVCKRYEELKDFGVPPGLRTLSSCLRPRKKD